MVSTDRKQSKFFQVCVSSQSRANGEVGFKAKSTGGINIYSHVTEELLGLHF